MPFHVEFAEAWVCTADRSRAGSTRLLPHRVLTGGARGKVAWIARVALSLRPLLTQP
jgi:hypothetical protein